MIELYINKYGKKCYRGVNENTPLRVLEFHEVPDQIDADKQWALHTNLGSLTVLNRMTGFGWRDTESGFRDEKGNFWLASTGYNVMEEFSLMSLSIGEAIKWVKENANTCVGVEP